MLPPDAMLKASAAIVGLTLAALVAVAAPRDRAGRWLAVFFGLIAINQGAEVVRSVATDPLPAYRIATIAASLDPIALLLFTYQAARGRMPSTLLLSIALPGAALALASGWVLPPMGLDFASRAIPTALAGYTTTVYLAATYLAVMALKRDDGAARWRALVVACTIVVLPQAVAALDHLAFILPAMPGPAMRLPFVLLVVVLVGTGLLMGAARTGDPRARSAVWMGLVVGAILLATAKTLDVVSAVTATPDYELDERWVLPGRASASVKWLVFGVLVSRAAFRDRAFDSSVRARRRAARGLVALGFGVAAVLAATVILAIRGGASTGFPWSETVIVTVAIALSQAFRDLVDRVAARVYGVPRALDVSTSHDVYRRASAAALARGTLPTQDRELRKLREELGIDAQAAAVIERLALDTPGDALQEGAIVGGRYRLDRLIGRGNAGRTFRARDLVLDRDAAIKVLHATEDDARVLREARLAGTIADPHVVTVFDVIERPGQALVVMEYVPGGDLASRVDELPPEERWSVFLGVVAGVAAAHARGIVHGDVKPANVVLTREGVPKIADFGLARLQRGATVGAGTMAVFAGTPAWMSPEQREGRAATKASDVYALGLLGRRILPEPPSSAVGTVLARALDAVPSRRWPDAASMLAALRAAAQAQ